MENPSKYAIFLSHASHDEELARGLQSLIEHSIEARVGERLVFRSTEEGSVGGGSDWYAEVIAALRASRLCLTLLTPNSIHQPWLLYESGAAYALQPVAESRKLICALAGGIGAYDLPGPYQRLQHRNLENPDSLAAVLNDIAVVLHQNVSPDAAEMQKIGALASGKGRRWETVKPSLVVEASDGSPFNVEHLIRLARKRVIAIGQNLHWLSLSIECHDEIIKFLAVPGHRFDVVICDVENESAVEVLSTVNPSMNIDQNTYSYHLRAATDRFLALKKRCEIEGVMGFNLHVRTLIPLGAIIIDPDEPQGLLVLQPLVNHGPKAAERPQFPISKRLNNRVFSYYWRCFDTLLTFGTRL